MCGITGFFGEGTAEDLRRMNTTLTRRGPDGEGYFSDPAARIFLGSRRLAIIDVAGGNQPIANEDGSVVVVLNGEIYNYRELRAQLESRHTFKTHSDTETIVHLYEEEGEALVKKLEGMFAFALWDTQKKTLLLARDRFGEKPLYYASFPGVFIFGSEIKALLAHPAATRELDRAALVAYLQHEYVPAPTTIFKNIRKLPAGHTLTIAANGTASIWRYWDIQSADGGTPPPALSDEKTLIRGLDAHLSRSVKSMLISDVPLGVFLSGGIDSSTIAWYAQEHAEGKINTFSIGFEDASFDESAHAAAAAKRLGTNHTAAIFSDRELLAMLPNLYTYMDEPFADPSLLPTALLSQAARKRLTVALGGDGADELFMGYPTFQAEKLVHWYRLIPRAVREHIIRPLTDSLPSSSQYLSFDYRLKRFIRHTDESPEDRHGAWIGAFSPENLSSLLTEDFKNSVGFSVPSQDNPLTRGLSSLSRLSLDNETMSRVNAYYLSHYLEGDILAKVDRASMFASLETRAPFLDPGLAAFIFALPAKYKLRGFKTKYLLKKLMRERLGRDITDRKKHGFQPPISRWLRTDLVPLIREHLNEDALRRGGIFNPAYVAQIIDRHQSGKADFRKELWTLLVFHLWKQHWLV
ncbi:MAG: asparagine synthase (glutamine-hydrolyzing) [Candidatus Sungiibacteriota bacterium]